MRYIFFILSILISQIANAQMVTQPGLGDYQMSGRNLPDSVLYILGTDTLDGSAKQGLGKFLTAESLRGFFKDTDWLKYRTGTIPNNTDTMYHVGVATVGDDSVYLSTNVLSGVLNVVGRLDLRLGEVGDYNIAIGREAGRSAQTGNLNIAIGNQALDAVTTGSSNVAIGGTAGTGITTGSRNFALGGASLASNVTGSDNSALGNSALNSYTGSQNTAIGSSALSALETGAGNVAIGYQAGLGEISGTNNTFIGSQTGSTTEGDHNVFIGYQSGRLNEGSSNIFIGKESGENETGSELLYIDPSNGIPLIKGDFAADTLRINGDLSIRDAVSGASTDSVLVWTPSNGRVKMRNAAAFGGSGATDLSIAQSGATQVIQSSTGTDVGVRNLYGLLITEGATDTLHFRVDSSLIATQYDLTTISDTDDQGLTITGSGPTYTIDIDNGTDVIIAAAGINTLSESPANTLIITGTEVDGSTTNEIQDITLSGTTTVTFDLSGDATDATITGAGIAAISRSGNAITVTATEVDGSTTNETNTIEEGNSSVQTGNLSVDFQTLFDVATDGGTECNISLDLSEATTVTTVESDDWMIMHDAGSAQHQKMLWSDFSETLIDFKEDDSSVGTGNAIDVGEGLDFNMVSTEANLNLDASEFQIDGTAEGTEYVLIHDVDTTAGHRIQRRLVSSFSGGSDTNFGGDDLTWDANRVHDQSTYTTEIGGTNMTWKFQDNNATTGAQIILAGNVGNSDAPMGQIQFMYDDSGFATDQTAWTMVATRETDSQEHSTLEITANEAASAPPVATWEENENLSDNTQETSLRLNSGVAYTQYWESTGANAITLDRGYYNVALLTGHTGTITLPQIYGIDESNIEIDAAQVPIGQEYVITNLSGSSVTIAAYNPAAATNDDWLNGTEAGTYTLTTGSSVILKAVTIVSNEGHWFVYD